MNEALLTVRELTTVFDTPRGCITAVNGVSFRLRAGEVFGIVGESGCGKTQLSLSIPRLVPSPPGRIAGGRFCFEDAVFSSFPKANFAESGAGRLR